MSQRNHPLEPWERTTLRDYIRDGAEPRRSSSIVEDIIRLAIASASSTLHACVRKPEVNIVNASAGVQTSPAFEHRIVALFSE